MIEFENTEGCSKEYADFIEKFKPKKTTDDCYTPPNVYEVIRTWAVAEYGLDGRQIVRPFYPGGDYEHADYPDGCVVLDNPPFSILSKICRFYDERNIGYFLFAPSLTLFSINTGARNYVISDTDITYENGAVVRTAFVTNMGSAKIHLAPDLYEAIKTQNDLNTKGAAALPKYELPDNVATAARIMKIVKYGQGLKISARDCSFTRSLDSMRADKKAIFGAGFLLSEKAAAEKAAAEKAAAEKAAAEKAAARYWPLSDRELRIIAELGGDPDA